MDGGTKFEPHMWWHVHVKLGCTHCTLNYNILRDKSHVERVARSADICEYDGRKIHKWLPSSRVTSVFAIFPEQITFAHTWLDRLENPVGRVRAYSHFEICAANLLLGIVLGLKVRWFSRVWNHWCLSQSISRSLREALTARWPEPSFPPIPRKTIAI